jgi:hypothetical protein
VTKSKNELFGAEKISREWRFQLSAPLGSTQHLIYKSVRAKQCSVEIRKECKKVKSRGLPIFFLAFQGRRSFSLTPIDS